MKTYLSLCFLLVFGGIAFSEDPLPLESAETEVAETEVAEPEPDYRWAGSSNRIYLNGPGVATFTSIKKALPLARLEHLGDGLWHLRANLFVQNGATLRIHGRSVGGDCDNLRIQSNNEDSAIHGIVSIRADWGT
ncbi:MAG: hypothetical protein AAF514_13955, partial [Verrucomicrobiota bacterium]